MTAVPSSVKSRVMSALFCAPPMLCAANGAEDEHPGSQQRRAKSQCQRPHYTRVAPVAPGQEQECPGQTQAQKHPEQRRRRGEG